MLLVVLMLVMLMTTELSMVMVVQLMVDTHVVRRMTLSHLQRGKSEKRVKKCLYPREVTMGFTCVRVITGHHTIPVWFSPHSFSPQAGMEGPRRN